MIGVANRLAGVSDVRHTIYADDITLWVTGGSDCHTETTLQEAVKTIGEQLRGSRLVCSPSKSELLVLPPKGAGRKRRHMEATYERPRIKIRTERGQVIPEVDKIRVLGLLIERNRVNGATVTKLATKAAAAMRLIRRLEAATRSHDYDTQLKATQQVSAALEKQRPGEAAGEGGASLPGPVDGARAQTSRDARDGTQAASRRCPSGSALRTPGGYGKPAPIMTESSEEESEVYGRNNFQSRAHKLAALFLMTAGSANATQFPLMFIVYGGTPFLLAYLVFLGTVALPIMRLESNLAQFSGDGNRGIFSAVPLFIGLGYTMSLYAIVHIVGDSVPVSDQLLFLFGSLRNFTSWSDCPHFMTPNRTCYPLHRHGFALCKTARARLADAFRKQALSHGVPAVGTGEHMQVVLVPPKVYQHDVAGCLPAVPNYLQQYLVRRQQADWSASSLTYIRAPPLLSLAAVWMLVFAIAHQGFTTVKRFVYAMLGIHLATSCLLLIRGISLPGAMRGLSMLLYADWSHAINQELQR
ncbi:sodium- and chloride-dependent glycine transporter 2-like [Haemaphysalis longicornis]